jgi:hypothetical protein
MGAQGTLVIAGSRDHDFYQPATALRQRTDLLVNFFSQGFMPGVDVRKLIFESRENPVNIFHDNFPPQGKFTRLNLPQTIPVVINMFRLPDLLKSAVMACNDLKLL